MPTMQEQRERRREKIRKKKRRKLLLIGAAVLLVALIVILIVVIVGAIGRANRAETVAIGPMPPTEDATIAPRRQAYDYSLPAPQSAPVSDAQFADTLFVGDSRLQGFHLYSVMQSADILAGGAVNVSNVMQYEFELGDGVTTLGSLLQQKQYGSIYIMLGVNELGWEYADVFYDTYSALVDDIRQLQPGALIYIHLIVPVSSAKDGNPSYITNSKIAACNSALAEMARDKGIYYIDASEALCDENGYLQAPFTTDGLHFSETGIVAWYDYLKTHTVSKENYTN